jgi:hypothetical protein
MNVAANKILFYINSLWTSRVNQRMTLLAALDDGRGLVWLVSTCEAVQSGVP